MYATGAHLHLYTSMIITSRTGRSRSTCKSQMHGASCTMTRFTSKRKRNRSTSTQVFGNTHSESGQSRYQPRIGHKNRRAGMRFQNFQAAQQLLSQTQDMFSSLGMIRGRRSQFRHALYVILLALAVAAPCAHGFTSVAGRRLGIKQSAKIPKKSERTASSSRHQTGTTRIGYTSENMEGGSADAIFANTAQEAGKDTSNDAQLGATAPASSPRLDINIVLLDNYDSYTYNLYQYLASMCIKPPLVIANDAYSSWDDLVSDIGQNRIDAIVISPGPGTPSNDNDVGICRAAVERNPNLPILGVCLGHQLLGLHYGANVTLAPGGPVHGLLSPVVYSDDITKTEECENDDSAKCSLFEGIDQEFDVVRYHSLAVQFPDGDDADSLDIEPIAWCNAKPPQMPKGGSTTDVDDGAKVCMGLRHKTNPHYGVQFHPESIGTGETGYQILRNFCEYVAAVTKSGDDCYENFALGAESQEGVGAKIPSADDTTTKERDEDDGAKQAANKHTVHINKLTPTNGSTNPYPEAVFESFFAESDDSFWLDSSTGSSNGDVGPAAGPMKVGTCPIHSNSRFSIMGDSNGPLSKRLEYYGEEHAVGKRGLKIYDSSSDEPVECRVDDDILSYLRNSLTDRGVSSSTRMVEFCLGGIDGNGYLFHDVEEFSSGNEMTAAQLPFEFRGGYVGYLGYEVRYDSRKFLCEQELCNVNGADSKGTAQSRESNENVPTAAFVFADRSLVYDHWTSDWYLIGVSSNEKFAASSGGVVSTIEWMKQTSAKMQSLSDELPRPMTDTDAPSDQIQSEVGFKLDRSKSQYEADIVRCHEEIKNGESYELCLTNQLRSMVSSKRESGPFGLYKILRQCNPAPFAAFLNFGVDSIKKSEQSPSEAAASVSLCCSSPERFLSVTKSNRTPKSQEEQQLEDSASHGWEFVPPHFDEVDSVDDDGRRYQVESKPIKGTAARRLIAGGNESPEALADDEKAAEKLRLDVKNRAENLMIVDLLRNDLSRVCEIGSVHVPRLMHIESFTTVHQLVSTIRGILNPKKANAIDVLSACFPGGSMTGAPKLRSVDILDEMEQGVSRGPYSGCLGYISLNGCMDMNIVIRTAVVTPAETNLSESNEGSQSWNVSIGCGGAITALSESEDEYNEMLLKARAVKEAIEIWADDGSSS